MEPGKSEGSLGPELQCEEAEGDSMSVWGSEMRSN